MLRSARGWTRQQLVEAARTQSVQISLSTIQKVEDGDVTNPSIRTVGALADLFGISAHELLSPPSIKKSLAHQIGLEEDTQPSESVRALISSTSGGRPVATILHDLVVILGGVRGKEAAEQFAAAFDALHGEVQEGIKRIELAARIVVTTFASMDNESSTPDGKTPS